GADPAAHDLAALHRPDDGRRAPHHGAGVGLVPALEHAAEDAADAPLLDGGRRQQGVADDGVVVVRALAPLPYGGVEHLVGEPLRGLDCFLHDRSLSLPSTAFLPASSPASWPVDE